MPLTPGTKLGQYEVVESVGAGGMGEVYRARDTKLGRDVAIKVLPEEFARDKERLNRFEREARLLAQLNHSNIATLYGLEEHDGQKFLVMELVEGETLAERIARGPIAIDEAIPLFIQIAEGLEAAHEKAIIHRDLKPANIKIGPDGKPKILDFGLAKAFVGEQDSVAYSSQSPTLTKGTALGAIMGTASYMSPEQARGKTVDKRTDVWAFGCCLYEALTGRKAFDGETVSDIIVSVLKSEPDWATIPTAQMRAVLRRCLEKDPKRRLRDIGDVWLSEENDAIGDEAKSTLRAALLVATGVLVGALGMWLASRTDPPSRQVRRTVVTLPASVPLRGFGSHNVAISPDGRRIGYVADANGVSQIYLRSLDRFEPTPVDGTEGAMALFFSPSGDAIAFIVGDSLMSVRLDGSAPLHVCDGAVGVHWAGAAWMDDDTIVFSRVSRGLFRVSAYGGEPELVAAPDIEGGEVGYHHPQRLPGGWMLFAVSSDAQGRHVVVQNLESREQTVVEQISSNARYIHSGHLVYTIGETIVAAPFDIHRGELTGPPVSLADLSNQGADQVRYSVSRNGTLVYWRNDDQGTVSLRARDGSAETILPPGNYEWVRLAPDGLRFVAQARLDGQNDVWVYTLDNTEPPVKLSFGGDNRYPMWTRDAKRVIFTENVAADWRIVWTAPDGSQLEPELIVSLDRAIRGFPIAGTLSAEGDALLFHRGGASESDIWEASITDGTRNTLLGSRFNERYPSISPDGELLAYMSNRSGQDEVWLRSYPNVEATPPLQVSRGGGSRPAWSRDGRALYYAYGDTIVSVPIVREDRLRVGEPTVVASGVSFAGRRNYDVTHDGRLLVIDADTQLASDVVVVDGWFEELKRLVPTDN